MLVNKKCIGTIAPMLGLPSNLSKFTWSFANLVNYSAQHVCGPDGYIHLSDAGMRHTFHKLARNQVAREVMGDWVLMLDSDHVFEPDLLFRLLNIQNRTGYDIVTALYLHRVHPYAPCLWKFEGEDGKKQFGDWPPGEIIEVDCAGAGALLVRRTVFSRIWHELGEEPFDTHQFERGAGSVVGEDFAFFRRCKRLGIRTCCPTYIEAHHIENLALEYEKHYDKASMPLRDIPIKSVGPMEKAC